MAAFSNLNSFRMPSLNTSIDRSKALTRLLHRPVSKRRSEAAQIVAENRSLLRRAIRRGHSLATIAAEIKMPKRTLQKHLNLAGLFIRRPRKKKGLVIRPYKRRQSQKEK